MADRELRKLSRSELIDIIYALKQREETLTRENELLKEKLSQREISISLAGSIAEAALKINEVFEQAQKAADDYVSSVRAQADAGRLREEAKLETKSKPTPEEKPETEQKSETKPEPDSEPEPFPFAQEVPSLENWILPEDPAEEESNAVKARRRFEKRLSGLIHRAQKGGRWL